VFGARSVVNAFLPGRLATLICFIDDPNDTGIAGVDIYRICQRCSDGEIPQRGRLRSPRSTRPISHSMKPAKIQSATKRCQKRVEAILADAPDFVFRISTMAPRSEIMNDLGAPIFAVSAHGMVWSR
jgi:hypothetical protein